MVGCHTLGDVACGDGADGDRTGAGKARGREICWDGCTDGRVGTCADHLACGVVGDADVVVACDAWLAGVAVGRCA